MKKVVLYIYDKVNLGDDLFIHTIANRYPAVKFILWSDRQNKRTFAELNNVKVVDKDSRLLRLAGDIHPSIVPRFRNWQEAHADAVVYIGGSIFIEYESWPQVLNWWNHQAQNHRLYVLGANFGPYHTEAYRAAMSEVFDRAQDVCFRETYSCNLFAGHKVRWAPDILFSCPIPETDQTKQQVFLSVINCAAKNEGETTLAAYHKQYVENLCNLSKAYISRGYTIVLSSFCKNEGDEETIAEMESALPIEVQKGVLKKICYDGTNACQILNAISQSEYIIASRFHAVVLAIAAEKPVFPIVYSDKTIHILDDLAFDGACADLRTNEPISFSTANENLIKKVLLPTKKLKEQSERHFSVLDQQILQ